MKRSIVLTRSIEGFLSATDRPTTDRPTIVSVGGDGFSCAYTLQLDFIRRNPPFDYVFCFLPICRPFESNPSKPDEYEGNDGICIYHSLLTTGKHFLWTRKIPSQNIAAAIEAVQSGADGGMDDIVATAVVGLWKTLQDNKDIAVKHNLWGGRNYGPYAMVA